MFFCNIKIGHYKNYYNSIFYLKQVPFQKAFRDIYNVHRYNSFLVVYPIFYKKILFLEISTQIIKRRNMKQKYNLNQSLILEGTVSSKKCLLSVPVFSMSYIIY